MKNYILVLVFLLCSVAGIQAQSKENIQIVKDAIQLNAELEFKALVKLFDTTGRKRPVEPFMLHSVWASFREQYGEFKKSTQKKFYTKKDVEYIIEELEFDSGYVEIKFSFSNNHKISSYLLGKSISKAELLLQQKYRTPAYANSKSVTAKAVTFGTAPFIMNSELVLPKHLKTNDKIAAIVLVHGSGAGDMNEMNGPQQPFRDIAYGLAAKGFAVIRYDKRTLTYASECAEDKNFTVNQETVIDAVEAVKFLRTQPNIDPTKIVVLGHSLGGMMMPRIAALDSALAGVIFMAAPAKSFADEIIGQMDYLATLFPEKKDEYAKGKEEFVRLKTKWYDSATNPRFLPFGCGPIYWMDLDTYNQTEEAKKIAVPMLFLQGESDYQVTVDDYKIWQNALKDNSKVTFRLFSSLSHNLITCAGKPSPDDYKTPANVSPQVIDAIVSWLKTL
jgi:uncharacterized protein